MQRRCNIDSVTTRSNYEMEDERRTIGRGVDSTGRMDNYVFRESNESHERRSYRFEQNARSRCEEKAISFRLHFLLVCTTKKVTGTEHSVEGVEKGDWLAK